LNIWLSPHINKVGGSVNVETVSKLFTVFTVLVTGAWTFVPTEIERPSFVFVRQGTALVL